MLWMCVYVHICMYAEARSHTRRPATPSCHAVPRLERRGKAKVCASTEDVSFAVETCSDPSACWESCERWTDVTAKASVTYIANWKITIFSGNIHHKLI